MTYAVNAIFKLPFSMGAARICELNVGRCATFDQATVIRSNAHEDELFQAVQKLLEEQLDQKLQFSFNIVYD